MIKAIFDIRKHKLVHLIVMGFYRVFGSIVAVSAMLGLLATGAEGAKIMMAMSSIINTPSQHIVFSSITEPLVEAGHEVVLLAPQNKVTKGLSSGATTGKIFFESGRSKKDLEDVVASITSLQHRISRSGVMGVAQIVKENYKLTTEGCESLFRDKATLDKLRKEKFDLILTLPLVGCDALLAEYLKVPFIVASPVRRSLVVTEDHFGVPIPSSYVPFSLFTAYSDRMSFSERVKNSVFRFVVQPLMEFLLTFPLRSIKSEFGIRPDLSLSQVFSEAELAFVYSNLAFEFAQPTAPNWISIGGVTAKPAKPLSKDINDFVEGAGEHGFVIFTLGSAVTSLENEELAESIAKVFSELPQRVLWRYKGKRPENTGNNTLISDWLPQNDLLGHPMARMLIYHGGAAGCYEATSHGVPLLIMPLAADQMGNAARAKNKGIGRDIDKNTMTEQDFREAVHDVLNNPKYKANMIRASQIMKEQLATPQETVVFWVEHVLKFGGDHLRLRALELNFLQRNSVDVVAFLLAVLLTILWIVRWIVCSCCCRMCRGKSVKAKRE